MPAPHNTHANPSPWRASTWHILLAALTLCTLLVHGYHPIAEDGGLYVAGILYKLDPTLFPDYNAFVTEHLRFSLFAPSVAAMVHLTHFSFAWCLLLVNLLSIWLTLHAARQLLRRCLASEPAQLAGVALLAAWWTLPVAATSLMLMDPYVTARSLSMPLSLFAIAFALDDWHATPRAAFLCTLCLLAAILFHPLMAAYAIALVILLRMVRLLHPLLPLVFLTVAAIASATVIQFAAPPESPALIAAEITRYYWFLSQWHWYEMLGLLAPLLILLTLGRRREFSPAAALLCRASIALGMIATLIAVILARENLAIHLVARLQPLRVFLLIYAVMALLLGAWLQRICATRPRLRAIPAVAVIAMAAAMFFVQRATFAASQHLELPWRAAHNPNPWVQAFLWSRDNTAKDALFAIDANYITTDGEDAQTFRATAQRSILPDHSKDGGEASITPALAEVWLRASTAQTDLSKLDDTARDARLQPYAVTWMVLHSSARTNHSCPYDNGTVKVCRVTL